MSKYIIKNCPSCTKQDECIAMYLRTSVECKERNDCVMKQIVEKCKYWRNRWTDDIDEREGFDQIIELLDIQEVE